MLYGVIDECHHVFAYGDTDNNDNDNDIALHVHVEMGHLTAIIPDCLYFCKTNNLIV